MLEKKGAHHSSEMYWWGKMYWGGGGGGVVNKHNSKVARYNWTKNKKLNIKEFFCCLNQVAHISCLKGHHIS